MDGSCTVSFDGNYGGTYYLPCDAVSSFDDVLVFNGDTPIYMSSDINRRGNRFICNPGCQPAYLDSNENYVYISPENVTWNDRSIFYREYDFILVFCLIALVTLRFLTIFRR